MLDLKTLGLKPTYLAGFPLAPEPRMPSFRTNPTQSFLRPGRQAGELLTGPEGAVVGGVVASLVQLDHFLRRALDMGFFRTPNKFDKNSMQYQLRQLVAQSDKLLGVYASQYDNAVADRANRMSGVLGQSAELLLNLSARQVQSSLTHMHNMGEKNMDYVPVPVVSKGLLPTTNGWRLVAVESPYAGDVETNLRYLRACLKDCLSRRETPLAAHGFFTQPGVVEEGDEAGQQVAEEAGVVWTQYAQATVIYTDLGTTRPMKEAAARAQHEGRGVEYRTLPGWALGGEAREGMNRRRGKRMGGGERLELRHPSAYQTAF